MGDRLDVVVVNDRAFPGGGASKVALQSAIGLAERGHRVTVFAAMGPVWPDLTAAGVEVELLDQTDLAGGARARMALQGLWNREAARRLTGRLAERPRGRTVVHVHSWSKALSASVFAAAGRSGHPVVATLHDYGFVCPNAALYDYQAGVSCELKPLSLPCLTTNCDARRRLHKLWRVARQLALRELAGAAERLSRVICVSDYSHDVMRPLMPAHLKSVVVANPIDVADEGRSDPAASREFVYVGRFSREKGVLVAAEAARRAGVPLTLVGDGELRDEVVRLNPDATLVGWVSPPEVRARLRASRAVVLSSVCRETQGMVLPEAFGCGTPVIVGSGTAPASVITHGMTGLVFPNGDVDALAEILRRLAVDDRLVAEMGAAAHAEYWSAPATLDRHLDALEAVYGEVLV